MAKKSDAILQVEISSIKPNPKNPRVIRDEKFKKLKRSLAEFPDMLNKRPLVCITDADGLFVVLGGNMRLKAARELGLETLPIMLADSWTEKQRDEFLIKDNVSFGEWDFETLANEWDADDLKEWGMDIPTMTDEDGYTTEINIPSYDPSDIVPDVTELMANTKAVQLMVEIEAADIDEDIKDFLRMAATRHYVFYFDKIADFYASAEPAVQELMERNALVIIHINKAIDNGFVQLSENLIDQYLQEHETE